MDFKGTEQEKEMIITTDHHHHHHLLQLQNIQSPVPFPISPMPNSRQKQHNPSSSSFSSSSSSRYQECMKNHAASTGGNVLDGCGEFMPAGEEGTAESLKCAACNCHRNFHRREADSSVEMGFGIGGTMIQPLQLPPPTSSPLPNSVKQMMMMMSNGQSNNNLPLMAPRVKMGFGGGGGTESSSEEMNFNSGAEPGMAKKRFRTKFSQEQKEKMLEFAEKVGWRIPREDDAEARRFCVETGVKRHVLKVWMHNNNNNNNKLSKKDQN